MSNPSYQGGGSFLPTVPARITSSDPWNFDVAPTVGTNANQGTQTVVTDTATQTLTNKTLTTPTIAMTAQDVIATGSTGTTAAAISAVYPGLVNCNATGVSGAGVALATGAAVPGAFYVIMNEMTGALNIYAVGGTINGTTGTTAFALTATGNRTAFASCTVAGAWNVRGNT